MSDPVSTPVPPAGDSDNGLDYMFIIAMVCCGLGALLILVGILRLIVYACRSRDDSKARKQYLRQMEHMRRLEEYSLRTGGRASFEYMGKGGSPLTPRSPGSNAGFYWDEPSPRDNGGPRYVIHSRNGHAQTLPVTITTGGANDLNRHTVVHSADAYVLDDSASSIRGADVQF